MCDYCGIMWRRSQLRMDATGRLVCPDEGDGADAVTLAEENVAMATQGHTRMPRDAGNVDLDGKPVDGDPFALFTSDLYAWYRADRTRVDDEGKALVLRDFSMGGRDLLQSNPLLRPTFTMLGGRLALAFDGTTWMQGKVLQDWRPLHHGSVTIVLVAKAASATDVFGTSGSGLNQGVSLGAQDKAGVCSYARAGGFTANTVAADDGSTKKIIARAEDVGSARETVLRVNGVDGVLFSVTKLAGGLLSGFPAAPVVLGGGIGLPPAHSPLPSTSDVAEAIVIKRRITDDEVVALEAYLGMYT